MDLTQLKWTKNVNHQGDDKNWAYPHKNFDIFPLNWKTEQAENALKPEVSELILLRQRTKVTHIVKLLDKTLYKDFTNGEFGIFRRVQIVWIADCLSESPEQDMVFGYHVHLQGGRVMQLETPRFKRHWESRGGLVEFQNRVLKMLKLRGK